MCSSEKEADCSTSGRVLRSLWASTLLPRSRIIIITKFHISLWAALSERVVTGQNQTVLKPNWDWCSLKSLSHVIVPAIVTACLPRLDVQCPLHLVNEKASLDTGYTVGDSTKHIQYNGPPETFGAEAASVCTTCVQALPHKSPSREQKKICILLKFTEYFHSKQGESHLNPIRISKYSLNQIRPVSHRQARVGYAPSNGKWHPVCEKFFM